MGQVTRTIYQRCSLCGRIEAHIVARKMAVAGIPHALCCGCQSLNPIDSLRERVREERRKRWDCSTCGAEANIGIFKTCWRCHALRFAGRAA